MPKSKKKQHNHAVPTPQEFDPIDSAAENLADAVLRESARFKRQKDKLKRVAKKSLSDSPIK